MAEKIGTQNGIEAARQRWNAAVTDADPEVAGVAWPDKLAGTLTTLVAGHNEHEDRLSAVEAALRNPFPQASS